MNHITSLTHKIEYGDFQTPLGLAQQICQKLQQLGVLPKAILEPTCGLGAFIQASAGVFPQVEKVIGVEINQHYLDLFTQNQVDLLQSHTIQLYQGDFFNFDWKYLLKTLPDKLLIMGNFPWVTNSQQGVISGTNLPHKLNFQNYDGLEAMTGKGNFDISEWMLIQTAQWLENRPGYLAMLCKTAVARKFLHYLFSQKIGLAHSAIYKIDAQKHFSASVEACLLFCEFEPTAHHYDYYIYESLDSPNFERVGHRYGVPVRDLDNFEKVSQLYGSSQVKWRSGLKHDCASVMELKKIDGQYINGLGEPADLEPTYLFPLLKGSDIANGRLTGVNRYIIVTQKYVGEPTTPIQELAPKTWAYLNRYKQLFEGRKSRIYQNNPLFSIFGVGSYTFSPYKIAICSLYKKLKFQLLTPIENKPVMVDDTVYFLSFETKFEAEKALEILNYPEVQLFYSTLIFWDEKRPIKTSILNSLNIPLIPHTQLPLFGG